MLFSCFYKSFSENQVLLSIKIAAPVSKDYIVIFKDQAKLPAGYDKLLKDAGGKVTAKLDKLGAVEVSSTDASFLEKVKKSNLVQEAGVQNKIYPEKPVFQETVDLDAGGAETAHIAEALMTAADDNVDVVNMSLGGYDWFQDPDYATKDIVADVNLFNRAIQYAIQKGVQSLVQQVIMAWTLAAQVSYLETIKVLHIAAQAAKG
ncbi:hypothetical protein [Neobacillus niacini]|uniref:hypothetical protein n=1 Tax=Neobacillus niacini TaxID=86668 RepID=UPI0021CB6A01|nr:hypothetical protein [Neobacillus niacini]MCM3765675.1 hypothetical protein [Neobacillus niacini]